MNPAPPVTSTRMSPILPVAGARGTPPSLRGVTGANGVHRSCQADDPAPAVTDGSRVGAPRHSSAVPTIPGTGGPPAPAGVRAPPARRPGTRICRPAFPRDDPRKDTVSRDRFEPDDAPGRPLPPRLDPRPGRVPRAAETGSARTPGRGGRRGALLGRVVGGLLSLALLATSGWGWYLGQVA